MYYTRDSVLYLNGKFMKASDAHVDLYSQTLHYGFGAFEGIRSYDTHHGTKIFKAYEHFERLRNSCLLAGIPFTWEPEDLIQASYQVLERNNLSNAYLRPLVYCAPQMTLIPATESFLMITAWEWDKYHGSKPLRLCLSGYQRPNPASVKIDAKITGHYVNSILATSEAKVRGYDEALMTDMHGKIAEAPGANFFMEKAGKLITPPAGHILCGITRQTVFNICRELDIEVTEQEITVADLAEADSAFLCGTAAEIAEVASIDARPMPRLWKDSLGSTIKEAYSCQVLEKSYTHVII